MDAGKIEYARQNDVYYINLIGTVRYTCGTGLNHLVSHIEEDAQLKRIVIDLTQTDNIDSTTLGLLAKLTNLSMARLNQRATLISNRSDIDTLLRSMGFDQVFEIRKDSEHPEAVQLEALPESQTPTPPRILLDAHRTLGNISPKNAEIFHDVIELLEMDLSRAG